VPLDGKSSCVLDTDSAKVPDEFVEGRITSSRVDEVDASIFSRKDLTTSDLWRREASIAAIIALLATTVLSADGCVNPVLTMC